jgi:hypothetical protein
MPLWFPVTAPPDRPDLLVVLDGTPSRLAQSERLAAALPELLQGFDTATQITALSHWLRDQPSLRSGRVWTATGPDRTTRAVILARIALGSQGIRVGPADLPTPSSGERRKLLLDALRLTLWRATGSTGAWLVPQVVARKRADCGV